MQKTTPAETNLSRGIIYCRADELFLCRFKQTVNIGDIVIVLEKIGELVQCLALLRSYILQFSVRNPLETSGNELIAIVLDELLDTAVRLVGTVDHYVLGDVLVLILLLLDEHLTPIAIAGGLVILAGVYVSTKAAHRKK